MMTFLQFHRRGVLRCFIAYIIDLTIIIMQTILVISKGRADGVVRLEEVEDTRASFSKDGESDGGEGKKQHKLNGSLSKCVENHQLTLVADGHKE